MKTFFLSFFNKHPFVAITIEIVCVLSVMFIITFTSIQIFNWSLGIKGFGPEQDLEITVERLYVDSSGRVPCYMVGTDKGVFKIKDVLLPLFLFNADEIFSSLHIGKSYNVIIKGNKVLNVLVQEYPHVIHIKSPTFNNNIITRDAMPLVVD